MADLESDEVSAAAAEPIQEQKQMSEFSALQNMEAKNSAANNNSALPKSQLAQLGQKQASRKTADSEQSLSSSGIKVSDKSGRYALLGSAAGVALITLLGRALGFLRWIAQSWAVGAGSFGSAYASANTVPNIVYELLAGGILAAVVVPLVAAPLGKNELLKAKKISAVLFTWALGAGVIMGLALYIFAPFIAGYMVEQDASALVTSFLRIFAYQVPFYAGGIICGGILQAYRHFWLPALGPVFSSLTVIGAYLWAMRVAAGAVPQLSTASNQEILILGWGTTAGVVVMCLPQILWGLHLIAYRPAWYLAAKDRKRLWKLISAGALTLVTTQIAALVIMLVANFSDVPGTYNIFQYAQAIFLLPSAVLAFPIATVYAPKLVMLFARLSADVPRKSEVTPQSDVKLYGSDFQAEFESSWRAIVLACFLGVAGLIGLLPSIMAIFSWRSVMPSLGLSLIVLAPAVAASAINTHFSRTFFAIGREKLGTLAISFGWLVTSLLALIFSGFFFDKSTIFTPAFYLSLSLSLGTICSGVLNYLLLKRLVDFKTGFTWPQFTALTSLLLLALVSFACTSYLLGWPVHLWKDMLTLGLMPKSSIASIFLSVVVGTLIMVGPLLLSLRKHCFIKNGLR